jgi:TonB-dependent receptor
MWNNALGTSLVNFLETKEVSNKFLNNNLNFGPGADISAIRKYIAANKYNNVLINEYSTGSQADAYYFETSENIYAFYAMNKIQFEKIMLLAGARMEYNQVDYKANDIFRYDKAYPNAPGGQMPVADRPANWQEPGVWSAVYNAYTATAKDSSLNYTVFLPNIQAKYELNRNTIFRAAYTTGYARPNFIDLLPRTDYSTDYDYVLLGNPNLKAAYAHNFDLLAEHYLSNVGLLSGGFFYKYIRNFMFLAEYPINADNPYNYEGSRFTTIRQQQNGDNASVFGFEVTVNSTLAFLPGLLKNFMFTGNYSFVQSSAKIDEHRDAVRLPGQADHTANLALSYSTKDFTLQGAFNYIGSFISIPGATENEDIWIDGRWQLDVNGSLKLVDGLLFWVEAQNVLNSQNYTFYGDRSRVYSLQFNGPTLRCGFTYKF